MFGHDDQSQKQDDTSQLAPDAAALADDEQTAPAVTTDTAGEYIDSPTPAAAAATPTSPEPATVAPGVTLPSVPGTAAPTVGASVAPATAPNTDDLLDIKQQALQQLTPLVGHLEQSPEEKFRTTMMMIQASDNSDLIKAAYEAAMQIPDEKVRAQALLDIVNEINYFTHSDAAGATA